MCFHVTAVVMRYRFIAFGWLLVQPDGLKLTSQHKEGPAEGRPIVCLQHDIHKHKPLTGLWLWTLLKCKPVRVCMCMSPAFS